MQLFIPEISGGGVKCSILNAESNSGVPKCEFDVYYFYDCPTLYLPSESNCKSTYLEYEFQYMNNDLSKASVSFIQKDGKDACHFIYNDFCSNVSLTDRENSCWYFANIKNDRMESVDGQLSAILKFTSSASVKNSYPNFDATFDSIDEKLTLECQDQISSVQSINFQDLDQSIYNNDIKFTCDNGTLILT